MKRAALLAAFIAALAAVPAQAVPLDSTFLVTRPTGLGALTLGSTNASTTRAGFDPQNEAPGRRLASADGRFVVFSSAADGLAADDIDSVTNVYVRDNVTGTTSLVSRAEGVLGPAANGNSDEPSISANGQWVAFRSEATNLSDADEGGVAHVYKRNLVTGASVLVDRADGAAGAIADESSGEPSISAGGDEVAFSSFATNLAAGTNDVRQVYVRDGNSTVLASALHTTNTAGGEGSRGPSLSADGTRVAFTSDEELVPGDDNNTFSDVYVRLLGSTNTVLASRVNGGSTVGNGDSHSASIASDDHPTDDYRVAFASEATNLNSDDISGDLDVFVRQGGSVTGLVSRAGGSGGAKGDGADGQPSISNTGLWVAFASDSSNLAAVDTNAFYDVYVRTLDLPPGTPGPFSTILGSRGVGNAIGDSHSAGPGISPSGGRVFFESIADNFHPDDDNDFAQVFSRGLGLSVGEPTSLISRPSGAGVFRSGTNDSSSRNFGRSPEPVTTVSSNGRFVAFVSEADELSAADDNRFPNVFVRDTVANTTTLVSRASGEGAAANGPSGPVRGGGALAIGLGVTPPAISADGRRVAFASLGSNLVPGDVNGTIDVFVRDLVTGATELVSRRDDDTPANEGSAAAALNADGNRIAFVSDEELVADDSNVLADVYVRDLAAGTTTLVSRQTGAAGAPANEPSRVPAISGDGNRVAFATEASNLAPAVVDGNGDVDVYLRDIGANTTTPVSVRNTPLLETGNTGSAAPAMNADGTRVAFESFANNLIPSGDLNGNLGDIYVRDVAAGITLLASRGVTGLGGNRPSSRPALSADGSRVAFESSSTDLSPLAVSGLGAVYLRDLAAASTQLVSRAGGAAGATANAIAGNPAISANGQCVAFDSFADNLVTGPPGTDFLRTYMRAVGPDCAPAPAAPPPPPGGAAPNAAPRISGFRLTRTRFRVGSKRTPLSAAQRRKAPVGTTVRYRLSEAAAVTVVIERPLRGRRSGRRCVKPTPRLRKRKSCTRWKRAGTLRRSGAAGANTLAFSGRLGRRALKRGPYRVYLTAVDTGGARGSSKPIRFTIVPR